MTRKEPECIVTDCRAQRRPCGCGYLVAGTPCRNPHRRDEWERVTENQRHEEVQCSEQN